MEKKVAQFGFILACIFFFLTICLDNGFIPPLIISLLIMLFGWWFWED